MFERTEHLIGIENLQKIKNTKITIIGIGGVGGTALECLIRSGVEDITIIDNDVFSESNFNRQILSSNDNLGESKVLAAKKRMLTINPNIKVNCEKLFLTKDNIDILNNSDFIIDACDTVDTKIEIIKYAQEHNIHLISSMGMGNRFDPSKLYITTLGKTEYDPLSKKIRGILRRNNISLNIPVVASKEVPIKSNIIASMMPVPSAAGLLLAYYVINKTIAN